MIFKPLPEGLDTTGRWRPMPDVTFLRDITYTDPQGLRRHDQEIMEAMLELISHAETLLVLDQFLFNDFAGKESSILRPLSYELTEAIIARKNARPELGVWFITDPLNTLYGGLASASQNRLRAGGVDVIETRLTVLRDSNPLYSAWWRVFLRYWPARWGPMLPNPLGPGRVPLNSYFNLLNFKANHRKTLVTERNGELWGMVSSANPHDASSSHHNVAVTFRGLAAQDLLEAERAVAAFSGGRIPAWPGAIDEVAERMIPENAIRGRILTERAVERAALELLEEASTGDQVMLAMFYLSSRPVVRALQRAQMRGVNVRVLLDPSKDAFGRQKNGIPNRPVGAMLHQTGIQVRWVLTHGEQFHSKMLVRQRINGDAAILLGSSNFTRRNLKNYNLEAGIEIRGPGDDLFFQKVTHYFDQLWANPNHMKISADYSHYADPQSWKRGLYYIQETTGLSTF